jgi:replicative DNA helicase
MLQISVIKNLLNLKYYNKYRSYLKINKEEKELSNLYEVLDSLIDIYKRDITLEEYVLSVLSKYPSYKELVHQIEHSNIGQDVLQNAVETLVERQLAHSLALVSIDVSEGRKEVGAILDFYDKFKEKEKIDDVTFITDDLEELYNETIHKEGLKWRLPTLNKMLGSLRLGDFGFLFARPETGKTTFLASEVTFMAGQAERPILWFNNEEQGNKVKVRCYQAALGCDLTKLYSDRPRAHAEFLKRTKGNIKIYDNASVHKRKVEQIVKDVKPSLIIFDQIDKIKGFDSDREDLRLGSIYIWARELAKSYCPVIGVCQADVSGEGKKWLTMDNVANAKTSKQAEADWILGIGAVHDIGLEFIRYLHLSKNKLSGDETSDPKLRHGRCEVVIRPEVARYAELGG